MSVDGDLPWDSDAYEPSWYDVDDDVMEDPDDGRGWDASGPSSEADDPSGGASSSAPGPWPELPGPPVAADLPGSPPVASDGGEGPPSSPRHGEDRRPSGIFGLAAGALSDATRFVAGAITGGRSQAHPELTRVVDTVVGVGNGVSSVAGTVIGTAGRLARPVVDVALHPPLLPQRWHPGSVLEQFETAGRESRELGERDVVSVAGELIPAILQAVLDRIDLTQLVLDRVDLGRIVDAVDLDAAVGRVDIDKIIDRVDIDAILARVDIDGVVATVDLNRIVDRVDIDAILARVDIDGVIATVNLDAIIRRVDVNAIAATIDVDAIIDRVDLGGIAEEVIDEIDLPRIIRESTDSIASEAMIGVRLTSASGDDQVRRIMEKLHLRRRGSPDDDPTELAVPAVPLPARRRRLPRGSGGSGDAPAGEVSGTGSGSEVPSQPAGPGSAVAPEATPPAVPGSAVLPGSAVVPGSAVAPEATPPAGGGQS